VRVVVGTHPIPQKYYITHKKLGTWNSEEMIEYIRPTLVNEELRMSYD
jgi:hypothetical protein